jgi:uncharacterized protein YndB with AHSA1/START domain
MNEMANDKSSESDREILFIRVFDAPRELVFAAWTDPERITRWWGPRGFTTTTYKMEVKPGGIWRYVMHGPDGRDYQNRIVYTEIVEPELIAYEHGGDEETEPVHFRVTVTLEAQGSQTKLTMRALFPSAEERNRVAEEYGAIEGGKQTLDRLAEHLGLP